MFCHTVNGRPQGDRPQGDRREAAGRRRREAAGRPQGGRANGPASSSLAQKGGIGTSYGTSPLLVVLSASGLR